MLNFLKNKHLILAMFVAPVLAILAYFATDYAVSESPSPAESGQVYKLAASSNCRYQSGLCTLKNGDVEMQLTAELNEDSQLVVVLDSSLDLQKVIVSFVERGVEQTPVEMSASSEQPGRWSAILYTSDTSDIGLRLAVNIADSLYYAETSAIFMRYKTSFSQQNFSR